MEPSLARPELRRPAPPTVPERAPRIRLPEPPAFRSYPPGRASACASCSQPVPATGALPMCWSCGRPMCADCYWRHGLSPAAHRCTSCEMRGARSDLSRSGGRSGAPGAPIARP